MKYYSAKTVTQILGVTAQTLRNWDKEGKLKPSYTKSNGYPSSKMCSGCKSIKEKLLLSERVYKCFQCGNKINRDLNAAINLANYI